VGLEAVRQLAEAKLADALELDGVARKQVGRLLILTIHEIEILDKLALEHSPEEVIADYAAHVSANPKDRAGSFCSFVFNSKYNTRRPAAGTSMVDKLAQKAMDEIGRELERRHAEAVGIAGTAAVNS
jgi:hypothetical protein